MKPIITIYKRQQSNDYRYSHFIYGHILEPKKDELHHKCWLDTSSKINKVIEWK